MITSQQAAMVKALYRMGNPEGVIAAILDLTLWEVNGILKYYLNN